MNLQRSSGILLHPTSLPGPYGIGDLGTEAYRFVDFLSGSGQQLWQILPLAPTGYGDSPYAAFSAFAGNPLLISPEFLRIEGLLSTDDLANMPSFAPGKVEYGPLIEWKMALLRRSYEIFKSSDDASARGELKEFVADNATWLDDFATFMAVKTAHGGASWSEWEPGIALREPEVLAAWRARLADDIEFQKYLQFHFFRQWFALKSYANAHGVKIVGDIPIFVAYDSADVWAERELFYLDDKGHATVVAGVPPDYFSATGQYWGNPLYRWDVMAADGYSWWVRRFRNVFRLYDFVRLDHFRGFAAYWEVPANKEQTAVNGQWVPGPGIALFQALERELGEQPIIAEDLGLITPDVLAIRDEMGFPGMRVLQFAFGGGAEVDPTNPYLPHNYDQNSVVYTGTHDNDTTVGWYSAASEAERANVEHYLDIDRRIANGDVAAMGRVVARKLVRLAFGSVSNTAIVPLQDVLGLGSEARMNQPGRPGGNWDWRYQSGALTQELMVDLLYITKMFGRYSPPAEKMRADNG